MTRSNTQDWATRSGTVGKIKGASEPFERGMADRMIADRDLDPRIDLSFQARGRGGAVKDGAGEIPIRRGKLRAECFMVLVSQHVVEPPGGGPAEGLGLAASELVCPILEQGRDFDEARELCENGG